MDKFFKKYHYEPRESDAIRMIHDYVQKSYDSHKHEKGDKYLKCLVDAYIMIEDFFESKGIDMTNFVEDKK